MKVLLSWLGDYIETGLSAEEVAETLSDLGLPYESIEYPGDGDAVIDVEVTSNRGDCLGLVGIARELSAVTGRPLRIPEIEQAESNRDVDEFCSVEITEPQLCGRYTARIIEGVKVGPSPDWMSKRLEAVGMRCVNNVVDATNYAMMETGQPPHAFDFAKIKGGKIIVRRAVAGEQIVSIDGTRCELAPDMLVIADAGGPVAIAGVMGGLETEVSDKTTAILLEDAYFDPVSVRTTSRKLALPSEASFRFERTVDIEQIDRASKRTAQLIIQTAGGRLARGLVDVYPEKPPQKDVTLRIERLTRLLGMEIAPERVVKILSSLGFSPRFDGRKVVCTTPSWRRTDVYREADLIEEVTRVYGYGNVPTRKKIEIEVVGVNPRQRFLAGTMNYLNGAGFYETINVSFTDDSISSLFAGEDGRNYLAVRDESRKSCNLLRQTLIGSLLTVLKTNLNTGSSPCRIFEISDTFVPAGSKGRLPVEKTKLALVSDGSLRRLRGVVEGLVSLVDRELQVVFEPAEAPWAQAVAQILINGEILGVAGIVSQKVRAQFDFKNVTPSAAELDIDRLFEMETGSISLRPVPRFPAVERDISLIVDEKVRWSQISDAIDSEAPEELEEIRFVGIYRGDGIDEGKKSVTVSLRFRAEQGTLKHETVDVFERKIIKSLSEAVGAQLRTI